MGSVSSLISGHSFHSKHCRASQYKLRKSSHLKKLNRYSDGLLRFGFSQDSGHKSGSKSSKNEDFFYIKVSQKAHGSQRPDYTALGGGELAVPAGTSGLDFGTPTPQKLMPFPSQLEVGGDKPLPRPTAFKPVLPRSGAILHSSPESGGPLGQQLHPPEKGKEQELRPLPCSGGLSDSGRNSMSSLPTHSTSSSYQLEPLVTPMGPISRFGGSAHNILQCAIIQDSNMMSLKAMSFSDGGNKILNPGKAPQHRAAAEKSVCVRSPIATDESTIQELEQKLLEREGELQELQSSFEEKEISSCQAYEEKQRRCKEELEGLKQKCNSKLKQTSQKTQRTQQVLHLQVFQLQQEKQQLREELEKLMKEQNLLETKLRSYEKEKTSFAPALEETQWEVCQKSGEISLLKQQLKESQTELTTKTTEILSLKAQLKEVRLKMEGLEMKSQELEVSLRTKAMELEVCENELQRKKNESELLREKVNLLEQEILELRSELAALREQLSEAREGPRPGGDDAQALQGQLERLRAELKAERDNNEQMSCSFQHERQTWKEEKEKVIHYQKQLQQSYLHMYKRNQSLEKMLQQLAAGEDGKEPIELEIPGADVPYEDIIATEI
ncbi:leucine zipper putative tumor suppressor 1 [Pyrgilauda ruficollis]|uniref:leucine zipper putative tumor suppressor 1 n=1 Tax=Onychostruthus taczanowskii TaxID=356909 RepID=UPI001B803A99|nr:leucine zipper putative tumor suppressor 1 [Onychostruthus taczanowskii]XP_041327627.1 leucine zipper putative tumor suppressor 1 [Pyrgilauda ruficollis]